ncbi:hypothetical protein BCEP4_1240002 [Burkholderia cepacia]|nr:hypothetical protein BCEP4_1240002 [Burkholderia cepacia]
MSYTPKPYWGWLLPAPKLSINE